MSDATIATLAAGVVAIVTAIGGVLIAAINAKLVKLGDKADTLAVKAEQIHATTNSHLSAVTASLGIANEKIEGLNKLVSSLTEEKKTTAVATENVLVAAVSKPVPITVAAAATNGLPHS